MKVLYIYRNPKMGFSIGKVFRPIEKAMREKCDVDSIEMPCYGYGIKSLYKNIQYVRNVLKKKHYDIVHITGTEHYLLPFVRKYKTVVTVHDLGFYTNHKKNVHGWMKYCSFILPLKMASIVAFISEKSKDEALDIVSLGNYCVVPDCYSPDILYFDKQYSNPPIILHVGTGPNKNLNRVVEALGGLNVHLRIIGPLKAQLKDKMEGFGISYSQRQNLSDEDIAKEYMACDIVSFPSLTEGFGMPIIEGQAAGKIVVTSDLRPMNVIAGDKAILVNPCEISSIRKGFEKALKRPKDIIESGIENAENYSADSVMNMYNQLYNNL